MRKAILKQNDFQISAELSKLEAIRKRFEPFYKALNETGFTFTTSEFHQLAYGENGENLATWLRKKTVAASPELNALPISETAKLDMVKIADYSMLHEAHRGITGRREVYSLDIEKGHLVISETAKQNIIDNYTTYGNDDAVAVLKICEQMKLLTEQCKQKFGFNPLQAQTMLIRVNSDGETSINVEAINSILTKALVK